MTRSSSSKSKKRPSAASTAVDLSLLWKAAFCGNAQLRRGEWLRVDLTAGLRAIQEELLSEGDGQVSLSYLSTVYLGLCRILTSQLHHYCDNVTVPRLDFELLKDSLGSRKGQNGAAHLSSTETDPLLKQFYETCAQIETFKVQQEKQKPEVDVNLIESSLLSAADLLLLNQTVVDVNSMPTDANAYFDELYAQMNSVNFVEECTDLIEEHFHSGGEKKTQKKASSSKRFAKLYPQEKLPLTSEMHSQVDESIYEPLFELPKEVLAPKKVKAVPAVQKEDKAKTMIAEEPIVDDLPIFVDTLEMPAIVETDIEVLPPTEDLPPLPTLPTEEVAVVEEEPPKSDTENEPTVDELPPVVETFELPVVETLNTEVGLTEVPLPPTPTPATLAELLQKTTSQTKTGRPKRKRRRRQKKGKLTGKRQSGLTLHLEEYCKSKSGYQFAVEESADLKLTEPSRTMSERLTAYFSPAVNVDDTTQLENLDLEESQVQNENSLVLPEEGAVAEPSVVLLDDCAKVENSNTYSASPSDVESSSDVDLSSPLSPSINNDFSEEPFSDIYLDTTIPQVTKQPMQTTFVQPLKRRTFPVVKDYRQVVKTVENANVELTTFIEPLDVLLVEPLDELATAPTEKTGDKQLLGLLNAAMSEHSTSELPFFDFVNSIEQPPSRQTVAMAFCSLLSLSTQPNSGVKLQDKASKAGKSQSKRKFHFSDLTISLTKPPASDC